MGRRLEFPLGVSANKAERITFRVHEAPDGVHVNPATGVLRWRPEVPGLHCIAVEAVAEDSQLTDAEIVELDIAPDNEAEATRAAGPK